MIRMSNSLDPDQALQIVGPVLGPNCLPRLSAATLVDKELKLRWVKMNGSVMKQSRLNVNAVFFQM